MWKMDLGRRYKRTDGQRIDKRTAVDGIERRQETRSFVSSLYHPQQKIGNFERERERDDEKTETCKRKREGARNERRIAHSSISLLNHPHQELASNSERTRRGDEGKRETQSKKKRGSTRKDF
jgi:hypothetical protein